MTGCQRAQEGQAFAGPLHPSRYSHLVFCKRVNAISVITKIYAKSGSTFISKSLNLAASSDKEFVCFFFFFFPSWSQKGSKFQFNLKTKLAVFEVSIVALLF